jgi:hypothetical protein
MLGLNVFSLLAFAAINLCAAKLCKCDERVRNNCLRLLCFALLAVTLCQYAPLSVLLTGDVNLPVEFSAVASLSVSVILLTGFKKGRVWAAYSGLMAGFFYYAAMITAGGEIYAAYRPHEIYVSLFCHGTMYLCGLVSLKTGKFSPSEFYKLFGGVGFVLVNALLLKPYTDSGARIFIYEILDGRYMRALFPGADMAPVYYVVMTGLLVLSVILFFKLNKAQYERFVRASERTGAVQSARTAKGQNI